MATVNLDYILNELQDYNLKCWTVKDSRHIIAEQDDAEITAADSADILKRKLQAIPDTRLTVILSGVNKAAKKNGGAEPTRTRTYTIVTPPAHSAHLGGHTPEIEKFHHLILDKEREILQLKYALEKANDEIDSLKAELKEIEESPDGDSEEGMFGLSPKMIQDATQLLAMLNSFSPATPKPATLAGLPEDIEELKKYDSKADEVIRAILLYAKNDRASYNFYRGIIISNAKKFEH